jgi:hypothetical protein
MPSKGVKCFAYIAVPGVEIEFTAPKKSIAKRDLNTFTSDHLEVESSNLPRFAFVGKFSFIVRRDGKEITSQWVDVNSMTGSLGNGTMNNMEQTPSIFIEDLVVVYGFYDAGPGAAGLPKQHQCYVTVTKNYENWMRDVVSPNSDKENRPFHKMVLPAAHDMAMNSSTTSQTLLRNAGSGVIKEVLGRDLPSLFSVFNRVSDGAVHRIAPDIIRALAITQKDSLDAVLKIGARYFEFRPAKCHRRLQAMCQLEDTFYFQHGPIPGMAYKDFLADIVRFLEDHGEEIVVVQNRWDGVPAECPRPTQDDLQKILNEVLQSKKLQSGNLDDMTRKTLRELRAERKRLIVLQNVNQVSNYSDAASATLSGNSIVTKLQEMSKSPPRGHSITLLQCQATATNIRDVIIASVLDAGVSTSPILATKPVCDSKILPLLRGECGKNLVREEGTVVLMNDFFDGATADVAIGMCRERLG